MRHDYWSPTLDLKEQRDAERFGDAPTKYKRAYQCETVAEYEKMLKSPYWHRLSDMQRELAPVIYSNYAEFEKNITALLGARIET